MAVPADANMATPPRKTDLPPPALIQPAPVSLFQRRAWSVEPSIGLDVGGMSPSQQVNLPSPTLDVGGPYPELLPGNFSLRLPEITFSTAPKAGQDAPIVVRRESLRKDSIIIIPRRCLPPESNFDTTPKPSADNAQQKAVSAGMILATVISGGGLTLVFVRKRRVGRGIATLLATVALSLTVSSTRGNAPTLSRIAANSTRPHATVEITDVGNDILVILGRDAVQVGL
jgi:hypothetical protein